MCGTRGDHMVVSARTREKTGLVVRGREKESKGGVERGEKKEKEQKRETRVRVTLRRIISSRLDVR